MNTTTTWNLTQDFAPNCGAKDLFRERFKNALRGCVRRGFSMEESFGMIWVETWEEISLSDEEQAELYGELLQWAKGSFADPAFSALQSSPAISVRASF